MNSLEILLNDKKAVKDIQIALQTQLKAQLGDAVPLVAAEARLDTREGKFEVDALGLLRFNASKGIATYALGFADAKSKETWEGFKKLPKPAPAADAAAAPAATAPAKSPEFELMKSFYMAIEPVLKAQGFPIDQKSVVLQEGLSLGAWDKIPVEKAMILPFTGLTHEFAFSIPLFGLEDARTRTLEAYGFKESARILVVDDALTSRKQSRNCLAMAGYFNVDECADGQAALSKVKGGSPPIELVVADWHMPVMSGFEMLKRLRATPETKKLPVILVTGEKNKDEVVSAMREGLSGYLVKPMTPDVFFKALKKAGGRA